MPLTNPLDTMKKGPRFWGRTLLCLTLASCMLLPPVRFAWHEVGYRWAYLLLMGTLLSAGLTPVCLWLALALRTLDLPSPRKVHRTPTPLLGGLAVAGAFGTSLIANGILDRQMVAILNAGVLLVLVGLLDDAYDLPAKLKLTAQLGATALLIHAGIEVRLFSEGGLGTLANMVLTVLWVVGITNAMNFFDGIDGLAASLAIVTATLLGLLAAFSYQPTLGWCAAALVGSCLGYLPYNWRRAPALIFLGDGGSAFLGFCLAALALKGAWTGATPAAYLAPVLVFWIFIYDMAFTTVSRIRTGKVTNFSEWLAYAGKDHLHHRMTARLGTRHRAVLTILLFSMIPGLAALALLPVSPTVMAALLVAQAALWIGLLIFLEVTGTHSDAHPE